MRPADAISTCLLKSFQFSGRASRAEYWWFAAFVAVVYVAAPKTQLYRGAAFTLETLIGLILLLPSLSAGSRRFQDVGRSRWQFLAASLVGMIAVAFSFNPITVYYADVTSVELLAFAVSLAVNLWNFNILIDGSTPGTNIYGPNPTEASK